ncbi:MAG TPA: cyclic nucleotide-binding domain-containing protein [Pyrinomonadaceae bacterium]|nr:cyclic nucleotide-binding domain-containing protein [Pyrinomonadaceae bacterium]
MPEQITNHAHILEAIRSVDLIDELVEKHNGHFTFELDLEVIAYGRNYTGKKVGPYVRLFVYKSGEEIIREGEWGGNNFYILVEGKLDVYIQTGQEDEATELRKVSEVQAGRSFGEMSVLAGLPRNATIVVAPGSEAKVLQIDRPALRLLRKLPKFGESLDATYREYGLKRTLEDLNRASDSAFSRDMIQKLEKIAEFRVFGKQHVLTREELPLDQIIFIKNGWVRRTRAAGIDSYTSDMIMEVEEDVGVDFLGAGNCLGLEGLRGQNKWLYTATVLARTEVLAIPIPLLRADSQLCDTLHRAFSSFSQADDDVRIEALSNKASLTAVSEEIETGVIDGTNLLVMDMDLCIRCGNCSLACHKVHGQSRLLRRGIHVARPVTPQSKSTQHVLMPEVCLHCQDPECLTGCPTGAIGRLPGGQIDIEPKTCIGCGDCATQCPYNAISMVPRKRPAPTMPTFAGRIRDWFSLAPPALPEAVTATEDLLAVKCNLCNNTPLNPAAKKSKAYSCQENCPTGALVRVNPKEYFDEGKSTLGLIYRDQTHAIGRDIHKRDPLARLFHIAGVFGVVALTAATLWAARKYTLDGRLGDTWLTVRWITGMVGLLGIAAVMTYSARKQVYRRRAGALRYWLLSHVYLGVIAGIVLLLHGGRSSGGLLTSTLMVSFDLVILSGLFGIACYLIVPRIMTSIEGDPLLIEDLNARREELRETLAKIDISDNELRKLIEGKVRRRFLSLGYLLRQYVRRESLSTLLAEAREEFGAVPLANSNSRLKLIEAVETSATLRRVDALIYLHQLLKLWLAPHVVSSALMLTLLVVHIIQVIFFAAR